MSIEVLFFGRLRTATAKATWRCPSESAATPRDVYHAATARFPALLGAEAGVRVAVNEAYTEWTVPLSADDVVAFIPPVAGGRSDVSVLLTADPIDVRAVALSVRTDHDGGVCTFTGHVRDNTGGAAVEALEYSAYESMARRVIAALAERVRRDRGAHAVAVAHRLGRLHIGEVSIAVAAAAPHRAEAFAACSEIVDAIKAEVPIFKLEHRPDGSFWVETDR